jgi:hypothetical protein
MDAFPSYEYLKLSSCWEIIILADKGYASAFLDQEISKRLRPPCLAA